MPRIDQVVGIDGADRRHHRRVVRLDLRPGHAGRLVVVLVDHVGRRAVHRRHLGEERRRLAGLRGRRRRADRVAGVPIDDHVDAEIDRVLDDGVDLGEHHRLVGVGPGAGPEVAPLRVDTHRGADDRKLPVVPRVLQRGLALREGLALVVEPLAAHPFELHRVPRLILKLRTDDLQLAVRRHGVERADRDVAGGVTRPPAAAPRRAAGPGRPTGAPAVAGARSAAGRDAPLPARPGRRSGRRAAGRERERPASDGGDQREEDGSRTPTARVVPRVVPRVLPRVLHKKGSWGES